MNRTAASTTLLSILTADGGGHKEGGGNKGRHKGGRCAITAKATKTKLGHKVPEATSKSHANFGYCTLTRSRCAPRQTSTPPLLPPLLLDYSRVPRYITVYQVLCSEVIIQAMFTHHLSSLTTLSGFELLFSALSLMAWS